MSSDTDRAAMRPFAALASYSDVRAAAVKLAVPIERSERISLTSAVGRVLAGPAMAVVDVPTADRAAMDGFALRAADAATAGAVLPCCGRLAAGQPADINVEPGTCVEIATGASVPGGADAVVPVEHTTRQGEEVTIGGAVEAGQHVSHRGEDLLAGRAIGNAGQIVHPAFLSACVAGGLQELEVWARPRVLVTPTGDEVVPVGTELQPGQVYDSNAAGLQALLDRAGAEVERADIVVDRRDALAEVLQRPGFDLVITIGGTSVGRRDLVADVVEDLGQILVHGVAVRPGKPLLVGLVGGHAVIGLPGFPTTCMMQAHALVDPLVRRIARQPVEPHARACELAEQVRSPAGMTHLMPVHVEGHIATPSFTFSSAVSSMAQASGWIEIDPDVTDVAAGSRVDVFLF